MVFGFDSRVRYSEVDENQQMTLGAVVDYFQDCSIFHSEAVGLGIDRLEEEKRAWILSSWQIVLHRLPHLGEKIRIETRAYGFKGFYGYRNFQLLDDQGRGLVDANSIWVFMNTESGMPTKVSAEHGERYGVEEKLPMEYAARKLPRKEGAVALESFPIMKYQLDTNHHVNNAQYIKMALEYLPEGFSIGQVRVEYKKEAFLYDLVIPMVLEDAEGVTVTLADQEGKPYAVVLFMENQ